MRIKEKSVTTFYKHDIHDVIQCLPSHDAAIKLVKVLREQLRDINRTMKREREGGLKEMSLERWCSCDDWKVGVRLQMTFNYHWKHCPYCGKKLIPIEKRYE
jgi:hypothetical protein